MEATFVAESTEQTIALGERLGRLLAAGDVLVLTGDLGAGKTQLTKGIARGLGVEDDVTSPTFTIGMVYEGGELPLYHFDLYRLEDAAELDASADADAVEDSACATVNARGPHARRMASIAIKPKHTSLT